MAWEHWEPEIATTLPTQTRMDAGSWAFGKRLRSLRLLHVCARGMRAAPVGPCAGSKDKVRLSREKSFITIPTLPKARKATAGAVSSGKGGVDSRIPPFPGCGDGGLA